MQPDWLIDAAELLAEPDPGPTPWLVEGLMVERALIACVGRWKTTKSYAMLDLAIAVATGRPAFGQLPVAAGPVVFVNEESGRPALWRRLDALCRGRAIDREELRGRLHVSARARRKLDYHEHQAELVELGQALQPRLFVFDPLARMKDAGREENAQKDMAPLIEFMLELRDRTDAAIAFVHHTGHQGEQMRGSSDLESAWESRLAWKRDGQAAEVTIRSEHRDEEGREIGYRIGWDALTRSMRFDLTTDPLEDAVRAYLATHPEASANDVTKNVEGNRKRILEIVKTTREGGSSIPEPPRNHPAQAPLRVVPQHPPFRGAGTTTEAPGSAEPEPPLDDDWLDSLYDRHADIAEGHA